MEEKVTDNSLSPEEWDTAQQLVEVVRQNNLGTDILIYFEHDFSAVNRAYPLGELVIIDPIESAFVQALAGKKMIDINFSHGNEIYIIKLREKIFTTVDSGIKRGA